MYVHKSQENNRVNDTISYKGKLLQLVRSKRSVHMLYAINITYKYCSAEKGHCFTEEKNFSPACDFTSYAERFSGTYGRFLSFSPFFILLLMFVCWLG